MNQINAYIRLNVSRLNFPLATFHARQLHSFSARVIGIPEDVTNVVIRVFKTDLTNYFELPVARTGTNYADGVCYIIGTCFPAVGSAKYEVHGYDAKGNMTALGEGAVEIEAFSTTGAPVTPGESIPITQIPDASGVMHTVTAVADTDGNFTTIISD